MSRLTKYLESLMTRKDKYKTSQTTTSEYFTIGSIVIRVSDHFGHEGGAAISIVQPLNSRTNYLVQVKEGPQILQFSFKDLKSFINSYCYISKIKSLSREVQKNKAEVKKAAVVPTSTSKIPSNFKIQRDAYTSDGKLYCQVGAYLIQQFRWYKNTKTAYRNILKANLFGKSIPEITAIMQDIYEKGLHTNNKLGELAKYFKGE